MCKPDLYQDGGLERERRGGPPFAFFVYAVLTHGFSLAPLSPSGASSGFLAAFLLSLTSISGAGTSTYLGEETSKPTRNATVGMWLALILGGIAMFLGSYGIILALNSLSFSNLGTTVAPARILFNLVREGAAPATFAKIDRFLEPLVGTALAGLVFAALAAGYLSLGVDAALA